MHLSTLDNYYTRLPGYSQTGSPTLSDTTLHPPFTLPTLPSHIPLHTQLPLCNHDRLSHLRPSAHTRIQGLSTCTIKIHFVPQVHPQTALCHWRTLTTCQLPSTSRIERSTNLTESAWHSLTAVYIIVSASVVACKTQTLLLSTTTPAREICNR